MAEGKTNAAINQLEAALNKISAQTGKKIDEQLADELMDVVILAHEFVSQ